MILTRLFRKIDWGGALGLLSPSLLKVFPTSHAVRALRELMGNYRDPTKFVERVDRQTELLDEDTIGLELQKDPPARSREASVEGAKLLRLYFAQIMESGFAFLDLRRSRFFLDEEGQVVWAPKPIWLNWDEDFLEGVRLLYHGFYRDEQMESLSRGLEKLNLHGFEDTVYKHFGSGDQRDVSFSVAEIQSTFKSLIDKAKDEDRELHHHFVGLGLYLVMLYDHLEQLGGSYDVREAFEDVVLSASRLDEPTR